MEASGYGTGPERPRSGRAREGRRLATETKQAVQTTEFWAYVAILLGLFIAGLVADADEGSDVDGFGADKVWLYAIILTVGYMLSRGLAKSGSHDPYSNDSDDAGGRGSAFGDRVKAAAQALREGEATRTSATSEPTEPRRREY